MKNQLNIRLTPEEVDLLETAVYLGRLKSAKDLVRPLLDELLAKLSADQEIAAALVHRRAADQEAGAEESGSVTPIAAKKGRKKGRRPESG